MVAPAGHAGLQNLIAKAISQGAPSPPLFVHSFCQRGGGVGSRENNRLSLGLVVLDKAAEGHFNEGDVVDHGAVPGKDGLSELGILLLM